MPKWEYIVAEVEDDKITKVNGKPSFSFWDGYKKTWDYLNDMGKQGWEVIEVRDKEQAREYHLKRQID
jgi:hypothetical protein